MTLFADSFFWDRWREHPARASGGGTRVHQQEADQPKKPLVTGVLTHSAI